MMHSIVQFSSIIRDLIIPPGIPAILSGKRMLRPFMRDQLAWINYFSNERYTKEKLSQQNAWYYLQKEVMPLIKQQGSSYHVRGIEKLALDVNVMPEFDEFQSRFYEMSQGFELQQVESEISPTTYFSLIQQKKFPCITRIRPLNEIFCGNEPDFWHEAIGHIAPLCFQEVQTFYLTIAEKMLSASETDFAAHLAVSWTLTEYAFINEHGQHKMFGAALIGSHLAHMRYRLSYLSIEEANRQHIIDSGFFNETSPVPRDEQGRLQFFCLKDLSLNHLI